MIEALLSGFSIGLGAGVSPGPLLALVISSTLERGMAAGVRVAASPLLSDLPILVSTLWLLDRLPAAWMAVVSVLGGLFVFALGIDTLRRAFAGSPTVEQPKARREDLWRGTLVNFLSPHPWLFWLGVGGPTVLRLWPERPAAAVAFVALFYVSLVGSKVVIAWAVARGRKRLDQRWYRNVLVTCGALLLGFGLWLGASGWLALEEGHP